MEGGIRSVNSSKCVQGGRKKNGEQPALYPMTGQRQNPSPPGQEAIGAGRLLMAHGRIGLGILDLGAPVQFGDDLGDVGTVREPLDQQ